MTSPGWNPIDKSNGLYDRQLLNTLALSFHRRSLLVQFASGGYMMDASLEVRRKSEWSRMKTLFVFWNLTGRERSNFMGTCLNWFSPGKEPVSDSPSTDAFSFMASASMRGRSTCSSPFCRLQKLDFLARYTALYANKVLFPLPLSHPSKVDTVAESRDELAQTPLILLRLRRLIRFSFDVSPRIFCLRYLSLRRAVDCHLPELRPHLRGEVWVHC
jgi:hypothetical protein